MWNWFSRLTPKHRTHLARRRYVRPHLEALEDRYCPSGGSLNWSDPTGGLLDPTFGSDGQVMTSFTNYYDEANAITAQPDGKIVIAGVTRASGSKTGNDFLVARYNADGSLDTSFGSGGYAATDFNRGSDTADAVALQPQVSGPSKILAAGSAVVANSYDFAVARYNANGSLDTTFGNKGKVTTAFSGNSSIGQMVVDGTGRIVVAGVPVGVIGADITLARYTANGALDTSFGSGGKLTTLAIQDFRMALQGDGRIVIAGTESDPATGSTQFVTARFNTNGTLDSTFGTGGVVTTAVGSDDSGGGVTIDGSGRILVTGTESGVECLLRYNPNGTLDAGFGTGGVVSLVNPSGLVEEHSVGVAIEASGQIVAGGMFTDPAGQNLYFVATRVTATGTLDTGYGPGGWASAQVGSGSEPAVMAIQPDGRLLLAGHVRPTGNPYPMDVALVRFLGAAAVIGSFTANPNPVASGSNVTLTASNISDGNPNSTITQVSFCYLDANGNPVVLGTGTEDSSGNWALTLAINLPPGTYTLYAQAKDNYGALGNIAALTLQVL
ncbi:MAG TPA: hypothetical protein VFA18_24790 [Gemmataceae bacterium]|nr:hypothetical protein [Gemmataceae bacterium]